MGVFEHGVLLPPYHNVNSENEARPLNIRVAHSWTKQFAHCIPIYSNAIHRKIPIGFVLSPVLAAQILIVICESPSFFGKSHILSNIPHDISQDIPTLLSYSHEIPGIFPCHSHISTAFHSCHWPFFSEPRGLVDQHAHAEGGHKGEEHGQSETERHQQGLKREVEDLRSARHPWEVIDVDIVKTYH